MQHTSSYRFPAAKYPAVRLFLVVLAGTLTAKSALAPIWLTGIVNVFLLMGWICSEFLLRKIKPIKAARIATTLYLLFLFTSSSFLFLIREYYHGVNTDLTETLNLYAWEELRVTGYVAKSGQSSTGRNVLSVEIKDSYLDGTIWPQNYRIRLYENPETDTELFPGDRIECTIRIYAFPERRNPHDFDYGKWLHRNGYATHGELIEVHERNPLQRFSAERVRKKIRDQAEILFPEQEAKLAKALFLGYKAELTADTRDHFSKAGLSHIMAVSGLHVGFIAAPFWLIIPWFWRTRRGKFLGLILLTLLLFGYASITGFSPSVNRASLMLWLLTYGKLFCRIRNSLNLMGTAALIITLVNPSQLFEVGFQLSFSAVTVILLVMPVLQKIIPQKWSYGVKGSLFSVVMISIVVQAGLFPVLIHYFNEFSITGPISNTLVIPLLSFTVPAGLLAVLSAPYIPESFHLLILPVQWSLQWIAGVAETIGSSKFSALSLQSSEISLFLVWISSTLCLAAFQIPQLRGKMLIVFLISILIWKCEKAMSAFDTSSVKVTFLDVGQGDAIHIETPGGYHLLIDAGRWSPLSNSGDRTLIPYFRYHGITRLDTVILTHPHADHIGGMPALMHEMQIGRIYQSDATHNSLLYRQIQRLAEELEIPVFLPVAGDIIESDPALRLFVVGPETGPFRDRNPNNRSVAIKMVYGETSFFFTGDAERNQEREMANRYGDFLKSEVYKAGHHASNTSSTEEIMRYVQPYYSVASLSFRNSFGHPGRDAVNRLAIHSNEQLYTSLSGAVVLTSNGRRVNQIMW